MKSAAQVTVATTTAPTAKTDTPDVEDEDSSSSSDDEEVYIINNNLL